MAFNNFVIALTTLATVAVCAPQAPRFPAGVNPAACPNYPYCDQLVDHQSLTGGLSAAPVSHHHQHSPSARHLAQPAAAPQQQQRSFADAQLAANFAFQHQQQQQQQQQFQHQPRAAFSHAPINHQQFAPQQSSFAPVQAFNPHQQQAFQQAPAAFNQRQSAPAAPISQQQQQPLPEQFPAGVSPAECPNFPYCHDGLNGNHLVAQQVHQARLLAAPVAERQQSFPAAPQHHQQHQQQQQHAAFAFQQQQQQQQQGRPVFPQFSAAQPAAAHQQRHAAPISAADAGGARFPAGVDPAGCPNYPFCHNN